MSTAIDSLDPGETYVNGKDAQTARDLLAAADRLGLDRGVVRTVQGGFVVPDPVWDDVASARQTSTAGEF